MTTAGLLAYDTDQAPSERVMRCPAHGVFLRHLTKTSKFWYCTVKGCKVIRSHVPETDFGLMLLGFTPAAADIR